VLGREVGSLGVQVVQEKGPYSQPVLTKDNMRDADTNQKTENPVCVVRGIRDCLPFPSGALAVVDEHVEHSGPPPPLLEPP